MALVDNACGLRSGRLSLLLHLIQSLSATFVYEHFEEDDNRGRSTKQLCAHADAPAVVDRSIQRRLIGSAASLAPHIPICPANETLRLAGPPSDDARQDTCLFPLVGGSQVPNTPQFTTSVSADYSVPLSADWAGTLHGTLLAIRAYWRIFNDSEYDKLRGYTNLNLAFISTNQDDW